MTHLQELAAQIADRATPFVFGIPGSGPSLELLDALEQKGVGFHLTHFEGTAALMAGAVGKLSGRSGVAVAIKGPGLTNMLPGLAACRLDAFPMVSISEAYLPDAPGHNTHKRLDHAGLLASVAKGYFFLSGDGPSFDHLATLAESELPGVVHLDLAAQPGPGAPQPPDDALPSPPAGDWSGIERLVSNARSPVVIAGSLAVRLGMESALNALGLPVFSTAAAKGAVDERLPHAAGVYTGAGGAVSPEQAILPRADLVVGIGLRHNEVLGGGPFDCPAIGIDPLGESHGFGFKFTRVADTADPGKIQALFAQLKEKTWGLDRLASAREALQARLAAGSFLPSHVYAAVAAHFENQARIVLDTGNFCTIGEHAWSVPRPALYLASGQGRYMGVGLPLAIGAALYDSGVPTVCFCGDGGIGMYAAEIKLALMHNLPLIVVLFSDAHLGTIRGGAMHKGLTQAPTVVGRPSWLGAFAGMGVDTARIENAAALEDALSAWSPDNGPLYLEAAFDPDEYQRMTDGIR